MNEGIHLDLDTWIVPGQIRKANLSLNVALYYYFKQKRGGSRMAGLEVVRNHSLQLQNPETLPQQKVI